MFQSLRNKLVLLYTISIGMILIALITIVAVYSQQQLEVRVSENYQTNINTVINKLKSENLISDTWLSQTEVNNCLLIYIEDNGNPLTFQGALLTPANRKQLFKELTALSLKEGIDIRKCPLFTNETRSSVFKLRGPAHDLYYGCTILLPIETGWRSIQLLQYLPDYYSSLKSQRIVFLLLALSGILALSAINLSFVTRMLKPIRENNENQMQFIASTSHELRSPLSVIRANNSAISPANTESQQFINGVDKECKRMAKLIDDMLLLVLFKSASWTIKKEPVETDTLLVEFYETFYPLCQQKEHPLFLDIPEEVLPMLNCDRERLQQVITILLDNALAYSPIHQNITLRGGFSGKHLTIEVEDHGIGITEKDKKYIFDRFYRVDPSRSDKQHFGLGLSIAKELIQLQGGHITVHDTPGGGSTFVIRFKI